jgi:transposase
MASGLPRAGKGAGDGQAKAARRQEFLASGAAALKTRHDPDDPGAVEVQRLAAEIGDLTMANELLEEKTDRLEGGRPFPRGRSRR